MIKNKAKKLTNLFPEETKRIFSNFGYLSVIQVFNLIFPLIIYPYLIRTVGKENYGIILFAQSITIFFGLLINYGFHFYGTNKVSTNRDSKKSLGKIVSTIFTIQVVFYLVSILLLFVIIFFTDQFSREPLILLFASYLCLNEIMIPVWYFQGIENMKFIAICNFLSKLVSFILIFILVNETQDYTNILVAYFIGALISGVFSFYKIFVMDKIKFLLPKRIEIKETLKESFPLFMSHILGGVTAKSNSFLIGRFVGTVELAYYDLAEKLVNLSAMFFRNFSNAIFPNVAKSKNFKLARKALHISLVLSFVAIIILYLMSDWVVIFLGGIEMLPTTDYLFILSFSIINRAVGPIINTSILVVNNLNKLLGYSFVVAFVSYCIGVLLLFYFEMITSFNIVYVFLMSVLMMLTYRIYYCFKYGFKKWFIA
ncbi:hypothetical protein D1815_16850 [Aquimarina sp. AD1]|uniref:oligosaccharide flippase family protein n=1 Tax=Aquimarina sp. (strain AD1) TaxID=1714848 RepID=UPI000E47FFD1|nr:oligosaccharide flippase family protein [Aquimarina sp. AD1]AXT57330.1 hypothetical protein D1815_16850 [Aquimarina sp. AD1]RKN09919.1 hypothetical protein D7035_19670 [Aquimarina sp. AD1]